MHTHMHAYIYIYIDVVHDLGHVSFFPIRSICICTPSDSGGGRGAQNQRQVLISEVEETPQEVVAKNPGPALLAAREVPGRSWDMCCGGLKTQAGWW